MAGMNETATKFATEVRGLGLRNGRLVLERPGEKPSEVTVRYLRPLTARTEIVLLDHDGHEVLTAAGVDAFPPEERLLVTEALRSRYLLPVIRKVQRIDVRFGIRYWWVETDRGPRWFALREPGKNVSWITATHLVLRDTVGNRFEIPDLLALDPRSRRWVGLSL
jgi:hypothetical protein